MILLTIWWSSSLLAILACVILALLIIRRFVWPRLDERFVERRNDIEKLMVLAASSPVDISDALRPDIKPKEHALVLLSALDMMRAVKGDETRKIAHIVLQWIGWDGIVGLAKDARRGRRIQVLTLMSYLDDPRARDEIFRHLNFPDAYVQLAAMRCLARIAHDDEMPIIFRQLTANEYTNVAYMADVFTQFGERALPHLVILLHNSRHQAWRAAIIRAIGNLGGLKDTEELLRFSNDPDAEVRLAVAMALGELQNAKSVDLLLQLANDVSLKVQQTAIQALAKLQIDGALETLLEKLDDQNWWTRFHAATALLQAGVRGEALLHAYVNSRGPHADMVGAVILERSGKSFG